MSDVRVRDFEPDDLGPLGDVVYEAFRGVAEAHGFRPAFGSPDQARLLLNTFHATELATMVTAVDASGVAGSASMNIRGEAAGIGPVAVGPNAQAGGIGRAMMVELLRRADAEGVRSVCLTQATYNVVSFSLYSKLGFVVRDMHVHVEGRIDAPEVDTTGVREMRAGDVAAASALDARLTGFRREPDFALLRSIGPGWVLERDGVLRGYLLTLDAGHIHLGPAGAEDDEALMALIAAAARALPGATLGANAVVSQPRLLRWLLECGLQVADIGSYMVRGDYTPPKGRHLRGLGFPEGL